jgi:hypothetical protein
MELTAFLVLGVCWVLSKKKMTTLWILNEYLWQFRGHRTFYRTERILDTNSLPAEQTYGWLKTLVDSGGDHGTQAFFSWLGLRHNRA